MIDENKRLRMDKAVQDFLTYHQINKDSELTIDNYGILLARFVRWLASVDVTYVDELTLSHLRAWVSSLQEAPSRLGDKLSDATVHQYVLRTKTFCRWLEQEELIDRPITTRFKIPRMEQKFIPTFTPEDVEKLLDACEAGKRYRPLMRRALTARNRAIVSVLIDTGIRRKELVGLRLCDVDRDMRVLLVHRKGNKWQQVPISHDGFKSLHDYLTKYRPVLAALDGRTIARKEDVVFLSDDGKPYALKSVNALFTRLQRKTGIEGKRVSPHQCRRYMATSQLAAGRSPLDVQRQMGHTTLLMTNRYASLNVEQLKRTHEMYSPLRAKQEGMNREGIGTGYWEEE